MNDETCAIQAIGDDTKGLIHFENGSILRFGPGEHVSVTFDPEMKTGAEAHITYRVRDEMGREVIQNGAIKYGCRRFVISFATTYMGCASLNPETMMVEAIN